MSVNTEPISVSGTGNRTAVIAMLAAGVFFTVVDVMMKLTAERMPVGETIVIRNVLATALILLVVWKIGELRLPQEAPWRLLGWRMAGEGGSTIAFLSALALMPIADAAGISQFGPLAITAVAAMQGEHVGWRRWSATALGFLGVMLIIKPGTGSFSAPGLLVLLAVALNIMRDFATRPIALSVSTLMLTLMSSIATLIAGLVMMPFETWIWPSWGDVFRLTVAGLFLLGGYAGMIITMRNGEVSAATPFRYAGMICALAAGWLVWNNVPDAASFAGILIVCTAGLYTAKREQVLNVDR